MPNTVTADFLDEIKLPPYWSENGDLPNPIVQCLFIDQTTKHVWYVLEGTRDGDDYRLYAFCFEKSMPTLPVKRGFRLSNLAGLDLTCDISVKGQKYHETLTKTEDKLHPEWFRTTATR